MGKIEKILKKGPVEGQTTEVYPVTSTKAVYDENNKRLDNIITGLQESIYLNAPIPISTENTPESMAQNVKNIADYVEKAKAAGIADVDGMSVTCIIDNDYSGVGYLYGDIDIQILGIILFDDTSNPYNFVVNNNGQYFETELLVKGAGGQIPSYMLDKGARNPIIITGDMTEVDEETYQKLLSGDVDVIANFGEGIFIEPQAKFNTGDTLNLIFGYSQFDESNDGAIATYTISINTSAPHTLTLAAIGACEPVSKSTLTPVLQEIDLTGTDADRKAKLDQFAIDWKALRGASDLTGARFVGYYSGSSNSRDTLDLVISTLLVWDDYELSYHGFGVDDSGIKRLVYLGTTGSITCANIMEGAFSRLEAITIYTGNTPEHMQANLDNIAAYEANLKVMGVDVTKGYMIPICFSNTELGYVMYHPFSTGAEYTGIITGPGGASSNIAIEKDGHAYVTTHIQPVESSLLTTTAGAIVPAINEVNALAKGYSTIFAPIELTTDPAQNKTAIDARVAAFTAQGISLTNGCCIPVTYKGVYAGNISLINGDWYGLLVKNTNNPADNINIKLSADGTITEGNSVQ